MTKLEQIFKKARINRNIVFSRVTRKSDLDFGYVTEARIGNGNGDLVISLTLFELNTLIKQAEIMQGEIYQDNFGVDTE